MKKIFCLLAVLFSAGIAFSEKVYYTTPEGKEIWCDKVDCWYSYYDNDIKHYYFHDSTGGEVFNWYNDRGDRIHFIVKENNTISHKTNYYEYDANDRMVIKYEKGTFEEYVYDHEGKQIFTIRNNSKCFKLIYNDKNQIIKEVNIEDENDTIIYDYDDNGNMISCKWNKQPECNRFWKYNEKGEIIYKYYKGVEYYWDNFEYDNAGRLVYKTSYERVNIIN